MHSSALSELRGLYEPSFAPTNGSSTAAALTRRTPKAAEVETSTEAPAPAPARSRDAAQVRGMLSGFRAGVARGRDTADPATEATSDDHQSAPTS